MDILALNCGSSSVKYQLYDWKKKEVIAKGMVERVTIGDCTLQASLQFLRYVEADLFGDRPRLRAWDERYRARPAAQNVLRW